MALSPIAKDFNPSLITKTVQKSSKDEAKQNKNHDPGSSSSVQKLSETFAAIVVDNPSIQSTFPTTNRGDQPATPLTNVWMSSRTTSRRPKAGQSMVADLQSLIIETALAKRAARRQPQNGLNRASKHDCFAVMGNGPLKGKKKKIVRPSDSNKKLSKLKKSVIDFRDAQGNPAYEIGETTSPTKNAVEACKDERRAYERLRQAADGETLIEIEKLTTDMLTGLKTFQDQQFQRNEIKARVRQRMYFGLREAFKYVISSKIRMLLLARDLEPGPGSAGLDQLVNDLLDKAQANCVPVVCALTRKKLQRLTHKPSKVACVAIVDPSGKEQQFERLKELTTYTSPFTTFEAQRQTNFGDEQTFSEEMLKTWTSTTRQGRFEFPVDKLF